MTGLDMDHGGAKYYVCTFVNCQLIHFILRCAWNIPETFMQGIFIRSTLQLQMQSRITRYYNVKEPSPL